MKRKTDTFTLCIIFSAFLHGMGYGYYYFSSVYKSDEYVNPENIKAQNVDVDFIDVPPPLVAGASNPAPVEKQEWIEGSSKSTPDAAGDDRSVNAVSGDGTDRDGFIYAYRGDRYPEPIIDFDLKRFFPQEARSANIARRTVVVLVQIDEKGTLHGARVVSNPAGYSFDDAAIMVVKRFRFRPGYAAGMPVKMVCKLPITFSMDD